MEKECAQINQVRNERRENTMEPTEIQCYHEIVKFLGILIMTILTIILRKIL